MDLVNHLQRIDRLFKKDERVDIEHTSLYHALFAWWYYHRNGEKVAICHKRMMRNSAIKSKEQYNRILIDLDQFGYIMLLTPVESGRPCEVRMIVLKQEKAGTDPEPGAYIKLPAKEEVSKNKSEDKHWRMEVIQKLVREILDRVLLLKIHVDKGM